MKTLLKTLAGLLSAAVVLVGCGEILVDEQMVNLDATGQVRGFVFLDQNGNRQSDPGDQALPNLTVSLVQAAGGGDVASSITEGEGGFSMTDVPVGTYRLDVPIELPDSFVISVVPDPFVVRADSITRVVVTGSYPTYAVAEVAQLEPGVRLFTTGITLNSRDPDGEGAVHLQDGSDYLRATDVANVTIAPGDSVRFQGRTAVEAGLPVLNDVEVFVLQRDVRDPVPLDVTTNEAVRAESGGGAQGSGGSLNASLVRIRDAEILDTATVDGHLVATVDDGTGPVDLVLREFLAFDTDAFAPEFTRIVEATGLLVAREDGGEIRWRILPRFPQDVELEAFPSLSLQQIRQLPSDQGATGHGIVLNPVDQPVPGTIHIREQGIHLRVRNLDILDVTPLPGDSVRVRGHTNREALIFPVLDATDVVILSSGGADPQPAVRTTLVASTASNGQLADGLVRVEDADVQDTESVDGALIATVDDGSGPVDVIIHDAIGFSDSFVVPGRNLSSVTGVLVPRRDPLDGSVSWRIAPRFSSDIVD